MKPEQIKKGVENNIKRIESLIEDLKEKPDFSKEDVHKIQEIINEGNLLHKAFLEYSIKN